MMQIVLIFLQFSYVSSQLVTMLFSRYLIAENIRKLPQIMPWIVVKNIVMTWSHHNPNLELFLVLKEYLYLSENLALSQQFIQINKVSQVKHFNQHFKDHPYHESTCTPNAIRKTRTFCKYWPNIISSLTHFLSCLFVNFTQSTQS